MLSKIRKLFGSQGSNAAPVAPRPDWKQLGNAALAEGNLAQAAAHYREGAAQEPVKVDRELFEVIRNALEFSRLTHGAFGLDDYVDYMIQYLAAIGPGVLA